MVVKHEQIKHYISSIKTACSVGKMILGDG